MKAFIATGWNFMRILRLIMGVAVLVFAIRNTDILAGLAGGFLVLMSVLNAGCCGMGACPVPGRDQKVKTHEKNMETIIHKEVDRAGTKKTDE